MKKHFYLMMLIAISISNSMPQAANIVSTIQGGNWNAGSTWQGGVVPAINDNVFLLGTVSLNVNAACSALTVHAGGILQNSGASHTLTVYSNLVNDGILRDQQNQLSLAVYGNLELRGTSAFYKLETVGEANQYLYLAPGKILDLNYFNNTSGIVIAQSNLVFYDTEVDFNYNQLILVAGSILDFQGNGSIRNIKEITITGNNSTLISASGYCGQNFTGENLTIDGVFKINSSEVAFTGNTVLNGTLENYGGSHEVQITGDFVNNGTLQNGMNLLTITLRGDITNDGLWNVATTNLDGTLPQEIWCEEGTLFEGTNFNYTGISYLIFNSNISFSNINVALNNCPVNCLPGITISATGGSQVFRNMVLNGNSSTLLLRGVYAQAITGNDLTLRGMFQIGDNNSSFNNTRLLDTLSNYGSSHSVVFHSDFVNTGRIYNGVNILTVYCTGDVYNYGLWECTNTCLSGSSVQSITFSPGNVFTGQVFQYAGGASAVNVLSDLRFDGTNINFSGRTLEMPDDSWFVFEGFNKNCVNFTLNGNNIHLRSSGGSYLQNVVINGNASIHGEFRIGDNNVVVNGNVTVTDTIGNYGTGHWMTVNGDFRNYGLVTNLMNTFNINVTGNLINGGDFQNNENNILGSVDEHIRLLPDKPINKPVRLNSNLGGNGWLWYKNGTPIPGATSPIYTLATITPSNYGIYYCISSAGQSRNITINENLEADFVSDAPQVGSVPLPVQFTNNTTGGFSTKNFAWDFGDGYISVDENPLHSFQYPGIYDVTLTVYDGYLESSITKTGHVFVCTQPQPDFYAENVCFGESVFFEDFSQNLNLEHDLVIRYASSVINFSSEWSPTNWGAIQILGEPDVYPAHHDSINAWAPRTPNGPREWIELMFDNPQPVCEVWIYETLMPGTVDTVYIKNPDSGRWEMVWNGDAFPAPPVARIFKVAFPQTSFPVSQVRIALNTGAVAYWNEIDAVAVVSDFGLMPSDETYYEWDVDGDGITDYTEKGSFWHEYDEPGVYEATLKITNNDLCVEEISRSLSVNSKPEFIVHPAGMASCDGTTAQFYAEAVMSGDYGINYIWVGPQGFLHQETQPQLVIDLVLPDDAGEYYLVAYNECGSDISDVATLIVQQNPAAYAGGDVTICENQSFTTEMATAEFFEYLWWESSGSGYFDDPGLLQPVYTPSVADILAGQLYLTLTAFGINPCTTQVSSTLSVTIHYLPVCTQQPTGTSSCEGSPFLMQVSAEGTQPIVFQWYGPAGLIEGATENIIEFQTLLPQDEGAYYCLATNSCGFTASETAFVTVFDNPKFVVEPVSIAAPTGSDAIFEVAVTGEGPLNLQWYDSQGLIGGETGTTLTIEKVNFLSGNTFYCIAENFCTSTQSQVVSLQVVTGGASHEIMLDAGWNGISTYLWLDNPGVETIYEPLIPPFIIMLDDQGIYWPEMGINTLEKWDNHQGYKIKLSDDLVLPLTGSIETEKTILLNEGWNLLPVLSECEVDVENAFAETGGEIVLIKEVAGYGVYWPGFGVNSLVNLVPGKAYHLLSDSNLDFTFGDCEQMKNSNELPSHETGLSHEVKNLANLAGWNIPTPTSSSHLIAIPGDVAGKPAKSALIGAFDTGGRCFGITAANSGTTVLTLSGDDILSEKKDGFWENEPFYLKYYDAATNCEIFTDVDFDNDFDGNTFSTHGLSVVKKIKTTFGNSLEDIINVISFFPNPATDQIHFVGLTGMAEVSVYDSRGVVVYSNQSVGPAETVDVSELPQGVYVVVVQMDKNAASKRLIKLK